MKFNSLSLQKGELIDMTKITLNVRDKRKTQLSKVATFKGLRLAHLRQLASYVYERDSEGWYYGNKEQFEKRHADLVEWIDSAVRYAESEK